MTAPEGIAVCAALLAAVGAVARTLSDRQARLAGLAALLVAWTTLALSIAPAAVRAHWLPAVAGLLIAAAGVWWCAPRLLGREQWLLAGGALVLTLRVPVPVGGDQVMLLGPLYVVIALGTLVLARGELRALRSPSIEAHAVNRTRSGALVDAGAAALPLVAALSIGWSSDRSDSAESLAFFYVPFLLLYACVRAWSGRRHALRFAAGGLLAAAVVAAGVGIVQALTREVWWNPKVIASNRFRADFRVNSLFWDPNIYGRALVVALCLVVAWLLANRLRRAHVVWSVVVGGVLLVALWNTYSQSSWFALATALALLGVLTLPARVRKWTAIVVAGCAIAGLVPALHALRGADTTGRGSVARLGLELASEHPLGGSGVGTFEHAATEQSRREHVLHPSLVASHATPITVLAELGAAGGCAYLLLLVSMITSAGARWRTARPGWPPTPGIWATAVVTAIVAHSLLYAGFVEDATLWAALAVLATPHRVVDNSQHIL
ncbi:MAG: O-antigen polymerase [Thermoleophilia bacterium]|nr:O-antigen polymerase [Thermoleophilia bacterium]